MAALVGRYIMAVRIKLWKKNEDYKFGLALQSSRYLGTQNRHIPGTDNKETPIENEPLKEKLPKTGFEVGSNLLKRSTK